MVSGIIVQLEANAHAEEIMRAIALLRGVQSVNVICADGVSVAPPVRLLERRIRDIAGAAAHRCGVRAPELVSRGRTPHVARARHVAMYLCRELLRMSYPQIGRAFSRDHTTAMCAVSKVRERVQHDPEVRALVEALGAELGAAG